MGSKDEHWCSLCNKKVTKKEGYLELNWHKNNTRIRGLCCSECMRSRLPFQELWKNILKLPNPTFFARITCEAINECPDFKPTNSLTGNCEYIAYNDNVIYCRRWHNGYTAIPRGRIKEIFQFGGLYRRSVKRPMMRKLPAEIQARSREQRFERQKEATKSLPK